ncbi:RNase adapter RapZ [Desulfovibrio sp. OttesenSCG-928-A18]|nr:RNase adapter RapZ [Desulfovibrio sp. OttesenSCG-928-A18]
MSAPFGATGLPAVIVTGLSGSGKSTALSVFEDLGFLTVDGLPAELAPQLVAMAEGEELSHYKGIALGMDLRQKSFSHEYEQALGQMQKQGLTPRILFLEASSDILLKRYATTRRPHPLEKEGLGLEQALEQERESLKRLRKLADLVIDTSSHSIHDLRRAIQDKWKQLSSLDKNLRIHLISFGFKYGTPSEADMVFDLRFLPNPYFDPQLRPMSGLDAPVAAFVLDRDPGKEFFSRFQDFMVYILQQYEQEGRYRLTVAIGCTGGRHRSVAVAEAMAQALRVSGYSPTLEHRHYKLG